MYILWNSAEYIAYFTLFSFLLLTNCICLYMLAFPMANSSSILQTQEYWSWWITSLYFGALSSYRANKISEDDPGLFPACRGKREKNCVCTVTLGMWSSKLEMQKEVRWSQRSGHCSYGIAFVHLVPAEGLQGSRRQIGGVPLILNSQFRKTFRDSPVQTQVSQLELHQQ